VQKKCNNNKHQRIYKILGNLLTGIAYPQRRGRTLTMRHIAAAICADQVTPPLGIATLLHAHPAEPIQLSVCYLISINCIALII